MAKEKLSKIREDHPAVAQAADLIYGVRDGQEHGLLAADIANLISPQGDSRLISGSVTWISGLIFEVSACTYVIEGVLYTSAPASITLDAADATNPRIDVIIVDTDSLAGKITGTPAADPAKPEIDPLTQLELTFVTVAATATEPAGISALLLYGEDAGDPNEWDATENTSGARIDLADTADTYAGTKAILFDSAIAGDTVTLTAGAGNELTVGSLNFLELHAKAISWSSSSRLSVAFFNGANRISAWVDIEDGVYGFDRTNVTDYQTIGIPNTDFAFTDVIADSVKLRKGGASGGGDALQAYVDQVRAQTGLTTVNNFIGLTENELINNVRTWNAQQPFGNHTLTDAASIVWDLDSRPIATVTLGGNRTLANPSNIRAGGTYYLRVIQDGTGSRTLAYGSAFSWPNGTAPTLSTAAAAVDILTFVSFDTTELHGVALKDSK